ncbi:riboflavin biosynthesis protein RibF [Hyphomicrobium sulfonivorans]|uniref:Riboflavin biosynthesis protein n=1 Tax=Hyphomicrobium sulfonivorans TaxID=121290 RepID=E0XCR4_HYPSL|nr:riboflavin biosynthesis protein RibF [Hyphomicrobium sulfonivorans]ADL39577.1 putative riboflavin biosynthesis protein RibF [Hyphomicrobium sulfonivorans]MBI1650853.1 riboflavin biosynthesis protein RibF [Hyphomicrobium sulfonivorans]NSL72766.1 riboflavin biosynthesis protein RibF [Hyphomicrobium sulfonivorans]
MLQTLTMDGREAGTWRFSELSTKGRHLLGGHVVVSSFDGFHRGHQALMHHAKQVSAADGSPVVALLFDAASDDARTPLAQGEEVARRLRLQGGANVVALGFASNASWLECQALCELLREFAPKSITVGANFRFGPKSSIGSQVLASMARSFAISTTVMETVACEECGPITAANIRQHLAAGDIQAANRLLGRNWTIEGPVVHGYKRGRELGFPTANVQPLHRLDLAHAIYAVRVYAGERVLDGVACYGTRPQFDDGAPALEVHILDFAGDLYGQRLRVEFVAHQRPELKFSCVDDLVRQMEIDRAEARELLAA